MKAIFLLVGLISSSSMAVPRFSDSTSAQAKQTIVYRIRINKISDLNFGEASPGDGPKVVAPGTVDTIENASFEVEGEPHRSFQIVLPDRNSVRMTTAEGGPYQVIPIHEFYSTPSSTGVLGANGKMMVFVGASRRGISPRQKNGEYLGQFNVTVVY